MRTRKCLYDRGSKWEASADEALLGLLIKAYYSSNMRPHAYPKSSGCIEYTKWNVGEVNAADASRPIRAYTGILFAENLYCIVHTHANAPRRRVSGTCSGQARGEVLRETRFVNKLYEKNHQMRALSMATLTREGSTSGETAPPASAQVKFLVVSEKAGRPSNTAACP